MNGQFACFRRLSWLKCGQPKLALRSWFDGGEGRGVLRLTETRMVCLRRVSWVVRNTSMTTVGIGGWGGGAGQQVSQETTETCHHTSSGQTSVTATSSRTTSQCNQFHLLASLRPTLSAGQPLSTCFLHQCVRTLCSRLCHRPTTTSPPPPHPTPTVPPLLPFGTPAIRFQVCTSTPVDSFSNRLACHTQKTKSKKTKDRSPVCYKEYRPTLKARGAEDGGGGGGGGWGQCTLELFIPLGVRRGGLGTWTVQPVLPKN